jgi:hypothetical protein
MNEFEYSRQFHKTKYSALCAFDINSIIIRAASWLPAGSMTFAEGQSVVIIISLLLMMDTKTPLKYLCIFSTPK